LTAFSCPDQGEDIDYGTSFGMGRRALVAIPFFAAPATEGTHLLILKNPCHASLRWYRFKIDLSNKLSYDKNHLLKLQYSMNLWSQGNGNSLHI
jgi:hypothetical protein